MMYQRKGKKSGLLPLLLLAMVAVAMLFFSGDSKTRGTSVLSDTSRQTYAQADISGEAAPIIDPYEIAQYLYDYGELPDNFITKAEAKRLGWDSSRNHVSDVAPGKSIGGDHYGNYEGGLPSASGRKWYECDANYVSGKRGAERVLYSSDGLVYYSPDHYRTFEEIPED